MIAPRAGYFGGFLCSELEDGASIPGDPEFLEVNLHGKYLVYRAD
jgi:hypothetical protein